MRTGISNTEFRIGQCVIQYRSPSRNLIFRIPNSGHRKCPVPTHPKESKETRGRAQNRKHLRPTMTPDLRQNEPYKTTIQNEFYVRLKRLLSIWKTCSIVPNCAAKSEKEKANATHRMLVCCVIWAGGGWDEGKELSSKWSLERICCCLCYVVCCDLKDNCYQYIIMRKKLKHKDVALSMWMSYLHCVDVESICGPHMYFWRCCSKLLCTRWRSKYGLPRTRRTFWVTPQPPSRRNRTK